jgi:putative lysine transport system permease protein
MSISEMNFWQRIVYLLQNYGSSYLRGAVTTMVIAVISTAIGCVIGLAVGIVQTIPLDPKRDSKIKRILITAAKLLLKGYVELFRGTPMIVQAVFIYYGAAQVFNIRLGMWQSAFLVVSINTGAYMAESVRGGIISIDPGQMEGAKAIGMNHFQAMVNVILPQAFRNIIPQIGNNLIINIKDTSVLSIISIVDLFFVHKSVAGAMYTYFESATIVMAIYLTMTLVSSRLLTMWEKYLDGSDNYKVVDKMDIGNQLNTATQRSRGR